jgi:type III secretion system YscI/HrpB-like protein
MATLTPVVLDSIAPLGTSLGEATRSAAAVKQKAAAFDAALSRQTELAQAASTSPAGAPAAQTPRTDAVDASERARRALDLDRAKEAAKPEGGDLILDGLQKLRGSFDARQAKVAELLEAKDVSASSLLAMQVEVVNYTLMVDVTSKLTGKSTQSFDTLMKGQ